MRRPRQINTVATRVPNMTEEHIEDLKLRHDAIVAAKWTIGTTIGLVVYGLAWVVVFVCAWK